MVSIRNQLHGKDLYMKNDVYYLLFFSSIQNVRDFVSGNEAFSSNRVRFLQ